MGAGASKGKRVADLTYRPSSYESVANLQRQMDSYMLPVDRPGHHAVSHRESLMAADVAAQEAQTEGLGDLNLSGLRARCAIAGLETTGTKAALIERLEAHHTQSLLPPQATSLDERLKDAHRLGSPTGIDGSTASDHVAAAPPLGVLRSSHLESREACEAHFAAEQELDAVHLFKPSAGKVVEVLGDEAAIAATVSTTAADRTGASAEKAVEVLGDEAAAAAFVSTGSAVGACPAAAEEAAPPAHIPSGQQARRSSVDERLQAAAQAAEEGAAEGAGVPSAE